MVLYFLNFNEKQTFIFFSFQFDIVFNLLFISTFLQMLSICKVHHIKWRII